MRALLAIAALIIAIGCSDHTFRRVPCSATKTCETGMVCVVGLCEPCGDACIAAPEDAGIELDAGLEVDAGVEVDAGPMEAPDSGPIEEDAGTPEIDAGPLMPPDAGDPILQNVDFSCGRTDAGIVFPPAVELPTTVPAECLSGFEMNNFHDIWSTASLQPQGSRALRLEVDVATYQAADDIRVSATVNGVERDILTTCRMQTASYQDPTLGRIRPPEDSIRQFRVDLPDGTTLLTFDFSAATTPSYIRVLGLCDFDLQSPPSIGRKWRLVSSR